MQITPVPSAAKVVGSSRILVGKSVTNPLGNREFDHEREKRLRKQYVKRAIEALQEKVEKTTVFTLDGKEE